MQQPVHQSTRQFPRPYPTLKQGWGLLGVLLLAQIPASIPALLVAEFAPAFKAAAETLAYALAFGLTIWFAFHQRKSSRLAFAPVQVGTFPVIALGTLALGLLIEPITSALPSPEWLDKLMREAFTKGLIFSAVLLAPVLEEVLLRGVIADGFLKRYSPTKAIVWSAVLFGVMHLNPVQTVGATILGLALGWLYYRTKSLWPCIFLHFVNNSIGSLAFFMDDAPDMSANYTRFLVGNDTLYIGLLTACVAVCFVVYRTLDRMLPKPATMLALEQTD